MFEDRKVKADVIAKIQAVIGEDAILRLQHLDAADHARSPPSFKDPPRFIGIHFFSPVDRMLLVEIILGKKTGDKALAAALDYVRAIRKTPIVVNDSRGFYANRCVLNYIQEGHLMLLEGVPAAMVENAARMAGMPVGPLSLNDETALDLGLKIVRAAENDLGKDAVNPAQKKLLEDMVEKHGRFGRKNGKGFYDYRAGPAEEAVAGARRSAAEEPDARGDRGDRRRGAQAALPGGAGGGSRAHLRGEGGHRRARGRCRLDPRLGLCALHRRHAVLHRHDGHEEVRRAVPRVREEIRRALCAAASCSSTWPTKNETFYGRFAPGKKKAA